MAKPGPPPKPTNLRLLQGNPSRRPINDKEPKPEAIEGIPKPPFKLKKEAMQIWERMCPMLSRIGLLTVCDTNTLARYCDLFARWIEDRNFIEKHGETYDVPHFYKEEVEVVDKKTGETRIKYEQRKEFKGVRQYPQVKQYLAYGQQLLRMEQEMGLTPAARSRIEVEVFDKGDSTDPMAEYLASNTRKN